MLIRLMCGVFAMGLFFAPQVAVSAISTFDSGTEGWFAQGDSQGPLTWSATGGNPGGHVFIDDLTTGGVTYFVAPAAFLGNQSASLGTNLTFDLRQVYPGAPNQFNTSDVVLAGAGLTLVFNTPANPPNGSWASYVVPLTASGWRVSTLAGAAATDIQFANVLGNLTALRIRAEYQTGPDVGSLDNVVLVPEPATLALLSLGLVIVATAGVRNRSAAARLTLR